jgi:hypothetical protein
MRPVSGTFVWTAMQVKYLAGTNSKVVNSQIFMAFITFGLPELQRRVKTEGKMPFPTFEKICICLCF